jgi:hypothetical protein
VTTVTEVVATLPGGRYGAIRWIVAGCAIAKPTLRPASAYAFDAVRTMTRFGWRSTSPTSEWPAISA